MGCAPCVLPLTFLVSANAAPRVYSCQEIPIWQTPKRWMLTSFQILATREPQLLKEIDCFMSDMIGLWCLEKQFGRLSGVYLHSVKTIACFIKQLWPSRSGLFLKISLNNLPNFHDFLRKSKTVCFIFVLLSSF